MSASRSKAKKTAPAGKFIGILKLLQRLDLELDAASNEREVTWVRARVIGLLDGAEILGYPNAEATKARWEERVKSAYETCRQLEAAGKKDVAQSVPFEVHRLRLERDFWVEQSRQLQNQLQQSQALNANLTEFLARTGDGITPDDIRAMLSGITAALREPVVGIEAVRALTAQLSGGQGAYTALKTPMRDRLSGSTPQ